MTLFVIIIVCLSFHLSTLEEYYTGGLYLGPCNGVTDGSVIIIVAFVTMGFIGNDFYTIKVYKDWDVSQIFGLFLIV